jgi:hypothetical protein
MKFVRQLYYYGLVFFLAPPAPGTTGINGLDIFGVQPGSPVLYTIPATGKRPMTFPQPISRPA